jgi:hypothetical protein
MPTKLNSSNRLDWTIALTSGVNKVSTTGTVTIVTDVPTPTVTPAAPDTPAVYPEAEKAKHIAFIKEALNTIDTSDGRDVKALGAKMLYDYMLMCAMDFVKAHERYKQTTITKAYQLKKDAPTNTAMIGSINNFLTALDQPLEMPVPVIIATMTTYNCTNSKCPIHGKKAEEVKPVATPVNTVVQPAAEKKGAPYNPDMALFIALAKKHDAKHAIENPTTYFSYYESGVKWGSVKGATKAEKMNNYLSYWSDGAARESLMKSLFTKNDLIFSDTVMTLYDEWQKGYKPTGATNRYKKMCAFIDAHKTLFTA